MRIAMGVIPHFRLLSSVSHRMFREKAKKKLPSTHTKKFHWSKKYEAEKIKREKKQRRPI